MANGHSDVEHTATSPQHARDWVGEDDPDNPRNWSLLRSVSSTAAVSTLAFVSTFAASIYAPCIDQVSKEFNVSTTVAILPLSLYTLGLAFGPLIAAPLCETYGRKILFLITTPIFGLFILGSGLSRNIASLVICRFFAGVFGSPAISNASATIIDYSGAKNRAVPLAFYYSIPFFGAVFGPFIGGFLVLWKGWRWTQWTVLFLLIVFYIPLLFIRESYKKTILQRRAKLLDVDGPSSSQRTVAESVQHFLTTTILRPLHMLFTEPIVALVCLYSAFQFGLMYTYVVASPYIFGTVYGFDLRSQSLSFLGFMTGATLAPAPLILIDRFVYQPRLRLFQEQHQQDQRPLQSQLQLEPCSSSHSHQPSPRSAPIQFPPENRLYPSYAASLALPLLLVLFAWLTRSSHPYVSYIVPIVLQGFALTSSLLIYAAANLYMMDTYGPLFGASASGANMLARYTLSAAFPLFALPMYQKLGVGGATTLLAGIAAAMAPIPWALRRFGGALRAKGKWAVSD